MTNDKLPSYRNPPLVETILNVQFEPVRGLKTGHLGAFWKQLGAEWPTADDAPAVEPRFERFSDEDRWQDIGMSLMLTKLPPPRLQIRNSSNDRMLQIQNGRMIFNWLKTEGAAYPRYSVIRQSFADKYHEFCEFLKDEGLPSPQPNQWEITYLNHIPQDILWKTVLDWTSFRPIGPVAEAEGVRLESLSEQWHFIILENLGRLHISWQHARKSDRKEMVVLNLTARGPTPNENPNFDHVLAGLDIGHSAIVRTFDEFIPDEAKTLWGRQNATA